MAFRALHAQWKTVFAHLADLGSGHDWTGRATPTSAWLSTFYNSAPLTASTRKPHAIESA